MTKTVKPEWAMTAREKRVAAASPAAQPEERAPRKGVRKAATFAVALAGLAVVGGLYGVPAKSRTEVTAAVIEAEAPAKQLIPSEIEKLSLQLLQETVRVVGSLAPQQQATLATEVGGIIRKVSVRPGDSVSKGDTLVEIDTENLEIQLAQQRSTAAATRAQLLQAENELARAKKMSERNVLSSSSLEEVEAKTAVLRANLEALEAQVASAEIAMRNATIAAPFSGVVSQRAIEPGQLVGAGTQVISLVDLSTLEFEATAPAAAATRIAPGQKVKITVSGHADQSFEGLVARVNPVTAQGTRNVPIYITLENPEGILRGGMFASGEVIIDEAVDVVAVPAIAMREDAVGFYVLKLEGGKAVRADVDPGQHWKGDRMIEIRSGLAAGDVILSVALPEISPDEAVTLVELDDSRKFEG